MPITRDQALTWVDKLADELARRRPDAEKAIDYYEGKHPLAFASEEWRKVHQGRYAGFSDNWCQVVANAPNERLRTIGIRIDDGSGEATSPLEREVMDDWAANDMDAQSSAGWLHSISASRSFVLVWDDGDGNPEYFWERCTEMVVGYDPEHPRRRQAALKLWTDDDLEYATLYTADEVWKFRRERRRRSSGIVLPVGVGGSDRRWEPREVPGEPWPLSHALGRVPVVEMPNRPLLGGKPLSEIAGTIAMQDAMNLLWAYLFGAADFASLPARVVMGQAPPKIPILDENGQKIGDREVEPEALTKGRLLWLTGQNTTIGQWAPANLEVFTKVIEVAKAHVAAQTRTPAHYLINTGSSANAPAESFTAAETSLVKKVEEMQLYLPAAVREVHALGRMVRGDRAGADLVRRASILWHDAENHSSAQLADALTKLRQIGFPFQWIAERYGLSPVEVARVVSMREAEADAGLLATISDALRTDQVAPGAP